MTREELVAHLEPSRYIGRSPDQVAEFLENDVKPVLKQYAAALDGRQVELSV